jgi:hypothetical protein
VALPYWSHNNSLDLISILDIVRDQVGLINFAGRMKIPASMDKLLPFLWIYLGSSSDPAQAICDVPVHGYHGFAGDGYALTSVELILLETTVWCCAGTDFGVNSRFYKKACINQSSHGAEKS